MVTAKEDLRDIKTARRDMKVFNFEVTDEEGGCIRICAFDDVADKFYAIIQKGSVSSLFIKHLKLVLLLTQSTLFSSFVTSRFVFMIFTYIRDLLSLVPIFHTVKLVVTEYLRSES